MKVEEPTQDELSLLLSKCRRLLRSILQVNRNDNDASALERVRMARDHVQLAVDALEASTEARPGLFTDFSHMLMTAKSASVEVAEPKDEDRLDLAGNTRAIPLPDLLAFLQMQAKTGVLEIDIQSEKISLVLDEGHVIHATSDTSPMGHRLGDILIERGVITRSRLDELLASSGRDPKRIGEVMEIEGLISHDQLVQALETQVQGIFDRLFLSHDVTYVFRDGHSETVPLLRMNVVNLLLQSSRHNDEESSTDF